MLLSFTSFARDKLLTFISSIIPSRILRSFISDIKDKLWTFNFIVLQRQMSAHRIGIGIAGLDTSGGPVARGH